MGKNHGSSLDVKLGWRIRNVCDLVKSYTLLNILMCCQERQQEEEDEVVDVTEQEEPPNADEIITSLWRRAGVTVP